MGKFKRKGFGLLTLFCTIATLFSLTSCGGDVIGGDNNGFENTGDKMIVKIPEAVIKVMKEMMSTLIRM